MKWAGGKRQLLPVLRQFYPDQFSRYIEPFFGSGAVFFDLLASGRLDGRESWLVDDNVDLIGCYCAVRDDVETVIRELERLAAGHRARGDAHFYDIRDRRFNRARRAVIADPRPGHYTPAMAAMLIYLNRTGFNGLFRLNARGLFNVPVGRYANPKICDRQHLRDVAHAFAGQHVRLIHGSFTTALGGARAGDLVYCDPPYAPLSRTSGFTSYTANGFTVADHIELQRAAIGAAVRGAAVIVSNSTAAVIAELYGCDEARRAGLKLYRVPARRAISSRADGRGSVDEFIWTNVRQRANRTRPSESARAHASA